MITSKHIPRITAVLITLCLITCGLIVYAAHTFDTMKITEYQKRLFSDEIITLDIQVAQEDWQELIGNAQAKEWITVDLIINDERFSGVGVRTKGNSSLSSGMGTGDGRYSLQFKFNKYVKGQTYYGLDTFCVNNLMGDATYMKDYLSYEIMNYIGVDTPLTNYANVSVNGEDYGFFLALERYDQAFLDRVYNTSAGQLYNVKIGMGMRGNFEEMWQDISNSFPGRRQPGFDGDGFSGRQRGGMGLDGWQPPEMDFGDWQSGGGMGRGGFGSQGGMSFQGGQLPDLDFGDRQPGGGMGRGGFGGGFGGQGGGSLIYTDDEINSYSAIFNNAVFNSTSDSDKQRVITAIENLNAGTDLEKYFDVDAILRYFAAHTVVVNLDSYISNMAQNYYIYERDGKLTILPWDYGLAFGGFQSGDVSGVVNFPIDTPVSGVSMEDRPLLNKLLEVGEYREQYHEYLQQIVVGYFESGLYVSSIKNINEKINEYVKNDASAYYTYEQYEAALPHLIQLGHLRAESIRGQLDGTIPSTSSGQNADKSSLIDASSVNLSALGTMGAGGMGGRPGGGGFSPENDEGGFPGGFGGGMGARPSGGEGIHGDGFTGRFGGDMENVPNIEQMGGMRGQGRFPDMDENSFPGGFSREGMGTPTIHTSSNANPGYSAETFIVLLVILAGATVFVAKRRKKVV